MVLALMHMLLQVTWTKLLLWRWNVGKQVSCQQHNLLYCVPFLFFKCCLSLVNLDSAFSSTFVLTKTYVCKYCEKELALIRRD
jgi:hypothetical protein